MWLKRKLEKCNSDKNEIKTKKSKNLIFRHDYKLNNPHD
jgi:hypothetical protein